MVQGQNRWSKEGALLPRLAPASLGRLGLPFARGSLDCQDRAGAAAHIAARRPLIERPLPKFGFGADVEQIRDRNLERCFGVSLRSIQVSGNGLLDLSGPHGSSLHVL